MLPSVLIYDESGGSLTVSQWDHVDALLTWILIYSYDVNWRTPYSGRLGLADGLCSCCARTRMRVHWLVDGFAGSLVCQYQLASLTLLYLSLPELMARVTRQGPRSPDRTNPRLGLSHI